MPQSPKLFSHEIVQPKFCLHFVFLNILHVLLDIMTLTILGNKYKINMSYLLHNFIHSSLGSNHIHILYIWNFCVLWFLHSCFLCVFAYHMRHIDPCNQEQMNSKGVIFFSPIQLQSNWSWTRGACTHKGYMKFHKGIREIYLIYCYT
jgi:hypothetical protein